jgi:hypothetical protein
MNNFRLHQMKRLVKLHTKITFFLNLKLWKVENLYDLFFFIVETSKIIF